MYAGKLLSIKLKYYGDNPEPVLDRLPTARVVEQYEHKCTIEAEVYGKGCLMWLLSQGDKVEILRPESLREEMKNTLQKMIERSKSGSGMKMKEKKSRKAKLILFWMMGVLAAVYFILREKDYI